MICHHLQNIVQVHDAEILEDLQDRFSAAFELGGNFVILQIVDKASFLDQRKQRTMDFFNHYRSKIVFDSRPTSMSLRSPEMLFRFHGLPTPSLGRSPPCPYRRPGPAPVPAIWLE